MGADGLVYIFAAEMVEHGSTYLSHTEPIATRIAAFDPATNEVLGAASPANSSASLYGWSITGDADWTYLYAQCHRQFGWQPFLGYDRTCSAIITVARVPRGRPLSPLQYWNGTTWTSDPSTAAPIITTNGRRINADQFLVAGNRFWSINKEGDWWGDTVYLSWSRSPTGPFRVQHQLPVQHVFGRHDSENAPVVGSATNEPTADTSGYEPLAQPKRLLDIRVGAGSGTRNEFGRLIGGQTLALPVAEPMDASAVALNVTAVNPGGPGYITVHACDVARSLTSNINHQAVGTSPRTW